MSESLYIIKMVPTIIHFMEMLERLRGWLTEFPEEMELMGFDPKKDIKRRRLKEKQ